ncbi:MAG: hybrid sensor histidine kinase/response regulator [Kiritimatiellae bacterium]|nr:hybrid sensor histidine kinase/response regulator [Kiritimatiellia bacterium]
MDTLRVLVVDDEPGMCLGAQRVLRRHMVRLPDLGLEAGFETDTAGTMAAARELLGRSRYDLVILDYKLPDGSGLDLLREIRAMRLDLLVIMITAFASLEVAVSATRNGAFDFLSKPFGPEELESVVTKAARALVIERRARRLEEERRKTRLQFLSVLAHELKAPIGAVEGILKLLEQRVLGNDLSAYDAQIRRALARLEGMRKLIFDLLDLTRIEAGERRRDLQPVDVAEVARAAIETVATEAAARRITVVLRADGPVTMTADRGELEIILNNLLTNAVKYNRDGGRVEVRLSRRDGGVAIEVEDTGIGMTAAEAARLFQEFSRIRNEKTRHISGSGLGLSTVKKLAQLYQGDVTVRSEPDVGSTFTVTLADAVLPATAREPAA